MADQVDAGPEDQRDARPGGGEGGPMPRNRGPRGPPAPVDSSDFWSDKYKMDHPERGVAIIINNKNFNQSTGMGVRSGTDKDASKMYNLFDMLGFEVIKPYQDLSISEMEDLLRSVSKEDFENKDCFACAILSHGDEGYVYGRDDKIKIDDLLRPFKGNKCPSLAGKPKMFFIQACRGDQLDDGIDAHDGESGDSVEVRRIPTEADFLMAYSVVPGFYSWRNSDKGSWFIQAVSDVFQKHWMTLDLLTMMTRVCKKVAFDFQSNSSNPGMSGKKQIPCITSMLTKDVFFAKKM